METKKFKINATELGKGGKKLTKLSILSTAGFTIAGGVFGAAAATAMNQHNSKPEEPQKTEEGTSDENQAQIVEPQPSTPQQEQVSDDNITEPQPTDNNQSHSSNGGDPQSPEEDIDPYDVAQAIAEEIDPNDIDSENILTPIGYEYAYLEDGRQVFCVIANDPEGNQYVLTDIDGDGMFGDIFDMSGNLVAQIDEGLSVSDLLDMMDDSGEYLAAIVEPWEDNPQTTYEEEVVEAEEIDDSELEDDILAQLTEETEEEVGGDLAVIDRGEDEDDEDEEDEEDDGDDEDDDDDDDDDDSNESIGGEGIA